MFIDVNNPAYIFHIAQLQRDRGKAHGPAGCNNALPKIADPGLGLLKMQPSPAEIDHLPLEQPTRHHGLHRLFATGPPNQSDREGLRVDPELDREPDFREGPLCGLPGLFRPCRVLYGL